VEQQTAGEMYIDIWSKNSRNINAMLQENKIRILIVDDYEMVRKGLIATLESFPDFEVVGEAEDGQEAVTLSSHCHPDVVLMDMLMPHMDGVHATALIRAGDSSTQVIAFSHLSHNIMVEYALKAGAIACLVKNASMDELVQAIRQAHAGNDPTRRNRITH